MEKQHIRKYRRPASGRPASTAHAIERGQLLVEIGIAVGIIATLAAMTATLIVVAQRNQVSAQRQDGAASLASEAYSILRVVAAANAATTSTGYNKLYCPPSGVCPAEFPVETPKGGGSQYRPVLVGDRWELETGSETVTLGDIQYTRFITIENVCRDATGDIASTYGSGGGCGGGETDDPSTQKLTVTLQAPSMADLTSSIFTTRWRNAVSGQSDWSGGTAEGATLGESVIHFAINFTEDAGDLVRAHVCKSADVPVGQTCPGGSWADSPTWVSATGAGQTIDLYYTPTEADVGTNNYWIFVCDDESSSSCGADPGPDTFTVNAP